MTDKLVVKIFSFSYHNSGIPKDESGHNGGFVFDCRCLPNPGREARYSKLTGKDSEVKEYFAKYDVIFEFLDYVYKIINLAISNYKSRQFNNLMVSFGCTGGQHRSVFCAERLTDYLRGQDITVRLRHLELDDNRKNS